MTEDKPKNKIDPKLLTPGQKPEDVIEYTEEEIKALIDKCYKGVNND